MNFRETRARKRVELTLELTPLIDVVFLLLLFFLITTTFVRDTDSQLPLDLPSAATGETATEAKRVVVHVGAAGELQIDDEQLRPAEIRTRLKALYDKDPAQQLLIKGDKTAAYGTITDVIDTAKDVGFERVNLVVKPKK